MNDIFALVYVAVPISAVQKHHMQKLQVFSVILYLLTITECPLEAKHYIYKIVKKKKKNHQTVTVTGLCLELLQYNA